MSDFPHTTDEKFVDGERKMGLGSNIYVIKNDINSKLYVGQTCRPINVRFNEHVSDAKSGSEYTIHRAMRKHGVEHFWIELIEETDNPNEREKYWIKKLGTYEHGYNETRGGEGFLLYDRDFIIDTYNRLGTIEAVATETGIGYGTVRDAIHLPDFYSKGLRSRIRMCNKNMVEIEIFNNLTDAAEYILKNGKSKALAATIKTRIVEVCRGKRKTAYGYIYEYTEGISRTQKFREIIQSDLNDNFIAKYNSCAEAAKAVNGERSNIRKCCLGLRKTYKNFKWKFGIETQYSQNCRPVLQIEIKTGKVLKCWNSIDEVSNVLKINRNCIYRVCAKKQKFAGGFGWRYADEDELAA